MNESLPVIRDSYRDAVFPSQLIPEIAELGFFGANLGAESERYGCAHMSNVEYGLVMQELERGDSGLRSFTSVQGSLVMYAILTFGSDEQKSHWLPRLQSGKAVGCFGLTEGFQTLARIHQPCARPRGRRWRRLGSQRREDVDNERFYRGHRSSVGADE